jgi:DNA-binding response OmpR family regulator
MPAGVSMRHGREIVTDMRILLIDDDAKLARIIVRVLNQEHFDVDWAADGETGLDLALAGAHDALIVDRMLPKLDGLALLRELRAQGVGTPALILTALGDVPERVLGLDAGADDYLGKPFAFDELLARLRALLRRAPQPLRDEVVTVGDVQVDLRAHTVRKAGRPVPLSPREYALLETLVLNRGSVVSRDRLLERVWGYEADPQGNVVDLYVHYLRRKLDGGRPGRDRLIRTVRGAGYIVQ